MMAVSGGGLMRGFLGGGLSCPWGILVSSRLGLLGILLGMIDQLVLVLYSMLKYVESYISMTVPILFSLAYIYRDCKHVSFNLMFS